MNINIPKPCNQNWNNMTPTAQGAFCNKCKVDVIDFSSKSNTEIKTILLANKGQKICGHINKNQLHSLNQEYVIWQNQSARTFQSKFLMACLFVFGMTLFTGCQLDQAELHDNSTTEKIETSINDDSTTLRGNLSIDNGADCPKTTDAHNDLYLIEGEIEISEDYYDSLNH